MKDTKTNIFKPYLTPKSKYKGGKGIDDIKGKTTKKIYKLSSNENPLGPSPKALQAIKDSLVKISQYPPRTDKNLCIALAEKYKTLEAANFICANSGIEIIELICRAFIDQGLNAIINQPAFGAYKLYVTRCGGTVKSIPLLEKNFDLDVEKIIESIDDNTRLIFLNSPNNPTGSYIPKSVLVDLLDRVPDHVVVVYDEVYFQLAEADDFCTAEEFVHTNNRLIAINSFSKSYGLAGMRIGYAYANTEISNYLRQLARPFSINVLTMAAGIAALQDESFLNEFKTLVKVERARICKFFDESNIKYWDSQANFIMFRPGMDPREFEEKMVVEGVMVRPVNNFGADGCIRVSIGTEEANGVFIDAVKKVLAI